MDNDDKLSDGSVRRRSRSGGDVPVPHGDAPAKETSGISSCDAVTRKVRNPLLESEKTAPVVQAPVSSAPSESPPLTSAGLVPPIDISENIHLFPPVCLADQEDKSSGGSTRARHKGLAIVVAIVVAGSAVDIFLWRTSSGSHPKTGHLTEAIASSTAFENVVDLHGTASATSTVSKVEPPPDPSHIEVSGKTADVDLSLDGIASRADKDKLNVGKDQQRHVVEASAMDLIASSRSASSSANTDPKIRSRRERTSVRPASAARSSQATVKPKKDVRVKSTSKGGEDFGMDLRTTAARRPTATIDERDPYLP